jgi:hypothetical protein
VSGGCCGFKRWIKYEMMKYSEMGEKDNMEYHTVQKNQMYWTYSNTMGL